MSEKILEILMQLFAIIAGPQVMIMKGGGSWNHFLAG
jgi:hypothetical protein